MVWPLFAVSSAADNRGAEIRAAFVYNLAKFVEWPRHAFDGISAPLRLCVLADAPGETRLSLIEGRLAQGREIHVLTIEQPEGALDCHILYFAAYHTAIQQRSLGLTAEAPVLTVGEGTRFINHGGMVALYVVEDRVRFKVNLKAVQNNGLKMSARILQLAQDVE